MFVYLLAAFCCIIEFDWSGIVFVINEKSLCTIDQLLMTVIVMWILLGLAVAHTK